MVPSRRMGKNSDDTRLRLLHRLAERESTSATPPNGPQATKAGGATGAKSKRPAKKKPAAPSSAAAPDQTGATPPVAGTPQQPTADQQPREAQPDTVPAGPNPGTPGIGKGGPGYTPGVAPAFKAPVGDEVGVSGTTNWAGLLTVEQNQKLAHIRAFGQTGQVDWGEWEKLHRTDHAVASALNLLVAPLREAEVEVEAGHDEPDEDDFGGAPDGDGDETDQTDEGDDAAPDDVPEGKPADLADAPPFPPKPAPTDASDDPTADDSAEDATDPADAGEDDPAGVDPEAEQAEMIASFVRDNLKEWLAPGWAQVLEQIVTYGVGYGFALHEIVWDVRDDDRVPGGKAIYAKKLAQRLPSSIRVDGWVEENGDLARIRQMGMRNGQWVYTELPADKVQLCTWNRNGQNYQGFSAFRPVWYLATMRAELLRILGIGSAREALGVPTVSCADLNAPPLSDDQAEVIQDFLENCHFHENLSLLLPRGYKLEWVYSQGANKGNVLQLWQALGLAIFEVVQQQQTQLGTNGTGSRSVGEVHNASKNAFVSGVKAWVEGCLNGIGDHTYTGIVKKIVDLNFGPQKKYPKVRLVVPKDDLDPTAAANALKTLVDAGGITLTEDDENPLRDRVGLAPVDPVKRALEKQRKASIATAIATGQPPPPSPNGPPDDPPPGGKGKPPTPPKDAPPGKSEGAAPAPANNPAPPPDPETAARAANKFDESGFAQWMPRRILTPAEQTVDLADVAKWFDTGRDRFEALAKPLVHEMLRAALPDLRDAMADGDPSEVRDLELDTHALRAACESFVASSVQYGYRQMRMAARRMKGEINATERSAWRLDLADKKQAIDAQAGLVTDRIASRVKQSLQTQAVDAARKGTSPDLLVDLVAEGIEESKALRGDAGEVLSRSFSIGGEEAARDEQINWVEYSAILDEATCGACEGADGKRFQIGSPEYYDFLPPYAGCAGRSNCRCIMIPVGGP